MDSFVFTSSGNDVIIVVANDKFGKRGCNSSNILPLRDLSSLLGPYLVFGGSRNDFRRGVAGVAIVFFLYRVRES